MIEENNKHGYRDSIHTINILDKTWKKIQVRNSAGAVIAASFTSKCRGIGCESLVKTRKERLSVHLGFCRNCSNKRCNTQIRANIKQRLADNRGIIAESIDKLTEKEVRLMCKKIDKKSIGSMIKEWDNSLDQSVRNFNRIFGQVQGGNQDDIIEVLEPYTHNGRICTRNGKEFHLLIDDEPEKIAGKLTNIVYDVFNRSTGAFIYTYRSISTLARDFDIDISTAWVILNERRKHGINIVIKERELKKE